MAGQERGRGGSRHNCKGAPGSLFSSSCAHACTAHGTVPQERQAFLEPYKHYKQFRDAGGQLCLEEFADAREVGSNEVPGTFGYGRPTGPHNLSCDLTPHTPPPSCRWCSS